MPCILTLDQVQAYQEDGYVIAREVFTPAEADLLRRAMEEDPKVSAHSLIRPDTEGGGTRISLWNRAGDSVYGLAARSARLVDTAETLIGEAVYHFQSKLTAKDPFGGGAWEWHQDYGYWYYNGCLRPDMLSMMIALDRSDQNNGCLQGVKGSHKLGRIDHLQVTEKQNSADPARMEHITAQHEVVLCELDPGDVLIFHSNTLHRSAQNRSPKRRWTLIVCYNAVSNDTITKIDDRYYVPLEKVGDEAILEAGLKFASGDEEHFTSQAYVPEAIKAS